MKRNLFLLCAAFAILFLSCSKGSGDDSANYGTKGNTWTFKEGSKVYKGVLAFDASLNTLLQTNNSYNFGILGVEINSGHFFNLFLSLLDLNFAQKDYQSGIDGNDYLNGFFYFESLGGPNTYKSSNLDPGPVMNFKVTSFDSVKDVVTITFSGQAFDINNNTVNITEGKVTAKIERL